MKAELRLQGPALQLRRDSASKMRPIGVRPAAHSQLPILPLRRTLTSGAVVLSLSIPHKTSAPDKALIAAFSSSREGSSLPVVAADALVVDITPELDVVLRVWDGNLRAGIVVVSGAALRV